MSKPWEEEWRAEGSRWVERRDDTRTIAQIHVDGAVEEHAAYTRLIAAAPDMARALRAMLICQNKGPCSTCEMTILAALTKAGVPLP